MHNLKLILKPLSKVFNKIITFNVTCRKYFLHLYVDERNLNKWVKITFKKVNLLPFCTNFTK